MMISDANAVLYAKLNARVARGECYWCGAPDVPDGAWCHGCGDYCPTCKGEMTGAAWGSRGECLSCYEAGMLPPESFADECIGLNSERW